MVPIQAFYQRGQPLLWVWILNMTLLKRLKRVPNKYFPFETHSIKIGNKIIEPPIPFFVAPP